MAESLLAATTSSGDISPDQAETTSRGFFSSHHHGRPSGGGYPGARPSRPSGGYPGARPQHQAYVPTANPVSSGGGGMSGVYNPHSHQASAPIVVQPQVVQPVTYKTIRVQIPAGMNPGSKLKVLTDNTGRESAIVTIPDRGRWRYGANGKPFFDIRVAEKPKPVSPVVV